MQVEGERLCLWVNEAYLGVMFDDSSLKTAGITAFIELKDRGDSVKLLPGGRIPSAK
jgi:hypothetical protein